MSLTEQVRPTTTPRAPSKPTSPRPKVRAAVAARRGGVFVLIVMLVLWAVSSASERTRC